MSLIEEALRRVQDIGPPARAPKPPEAQPPSPPTPPSQPSPVPATSSSGPAPLPSAQMTAFAVKWIGASAVLAVVVGTGLWTYRVMITVKPTTVTLPHQSQADSATALASTTAFAASTRSLPPLEPKPPTLKLSGIVRGAGEPFAIINDHIIQVGDSVEGATLVAVKEDAATLRWLDKELVLRTAR